MSLVIGETGDQRAHTIHFDFETGRPDITEHQRCHVIPVSEGDAKRYRHAKNSRNCSTKGKLNVQIDEYKCYYVIEHLK
jgi:hypothetical protein